MIRRLAALLSLACVIALSSCASPSSPVDSTAVYGRFTLTTVDGQPLPFTLSFSAGLRVELESGDVELRPGASHTFRLFRRHTQAGSSWQTNDNLIGTYTRAGDKITLTDATQTLEGTVTSRTLTLRHEGRTLVYQYAATSGS